MKFLMDETGTVAINTAFVSNIDIKQESFPTRVEVSVNFSRDSTIRRVTLKTFKSDDKDKNLTAAKKYFVELVDKLNSGGNL